MTTPNKDILKSLRDNAVEKIDAAKQAKEWFELYRDGKEGDLPNEARRFVRGFLKNGIPHEADNIHNGGAAVPSGEAGWRDDVPDESKPDQENVSVPQEGEHNVIKNRSPMEWFESGFAYVAPLRREKNDARSVVGVMPEGEVEAVWYQAGVRPDVLIDRTKDNLDWELCDGPAGVGSIAWYKLKDVADEQETIVEGSQEKPAEEHTGAVSEVETSTSIESDEEDYPSSDETLEEPSRTGSLEEGARNNGTVTEAKHPLASWIMEQEWPVTINEIDGDFVNYTDGEYDDILPINEFLAQFTPKGWERFDPERSVVGGSYEVIGENGLKAVIDHNLLLSSSEGIIFIREHENEGSEDGNSDTIGDVGNVVSPANLCSGDSGKSRKINEGDGGEYREPLFQNKGTRALDPPNQQAVDLVDGRVGDELDKLEGVE